MFMVRIDTFHMSVSSAPLIIAVKYRFPRLPSCFTMYSRKAACFFRRCNPRIKCRFHPSSSHGYNFRGWWWAFGICWI